MDEVVPNVYKHLGNEENEVTEDAYDIQRDMNEVTPNVHKHFRYYMNEVTLNACNHLGYDNMNEEWLHTATLYLPFITATPNVFMRVRVSECLQALTMRYERSDS